MKRPLPAGDHLGSAPGTEDLSALGCRDNMHAVALVGLDIQSLPQPAAYPAVRAVRARQRALFVHSAVLAPQLRMPAVGNYGRSVTRSGLLTATRSYAATPSGLATSSLFASS